METHKEEREEEMSTNKHTRHDKALFRFRGTDEVWYEIDGFPTLDSEKRDWAVCHFLDQGIIIMHFNMN